MVFVDIRSDVFLGYREHSGFGSNPLTILKCVDMKRSNPRVPHMRVESGWVTLGSTMSCRDRTMVSMKTSHG